MWPPSRDWNFSTTCLLPIAPARGASRPPPPPSPAPYSLRNRVQAFRKASSEPLPGDSLLGELLNDGGTGGDDSDSDGRDRRNERRLGGERRPLLTSWRPAHHHPRAIAAAATTTASFRRGRGRQGRHGHRTAGRGHDALLHDATTWRLLRRRQRGCGNEVRAAAHSGPRPSPARRRRRRRPTPL